MGSSIPKATSSDSVAEIGYRLVLVYAIACSAHPFRRADLDPRVELVRGDRGRNVEDDAFCHRVLLYSSLG
jgi:hypothetical protein